MDSAKIKQAIEAKRSLDFVVKKDGFFLAGRCHAQPGLCCKSGCHGVIVVRMKVGDCSAMGLFL